MTASLTLTDWELEVGRRIFDSLSQSRCLNRIGLIYIIYLIEIERGSRGGDYKSKPKLHHIKQQAWYAAQAERLARLT